MQAPILRTASARERFFTFYKSLDWAAGDQGTDQQVNFFCIPFDVQISWQEGNILRLAGKSFCEL